MASRLQDVLLVGIRATQPLPVDVATGTLYAVSDENFLIEQSDGSAWVQYGPSGSGGGGTGDVVGPASSVNDRIAVYDGVTGKLIKDGGATIADIIALITGGMNQLTGDVTAGPGTGSQIATLNNAYKLRQIGFTVDGAGVAITGGLKGYKSFPTNGIIIGVRMLADQVGSAVVDIWKDTYANYPPVVGDSITAAAKPTISAAAKSEDLVLTGWNTTVNAGDVFGFNVDSASTITRLTLELTIRVGV